MKEWKLMKQTMLMLLAIIFVFSITACSSASNRPTSGVNHAGNDQPVQTPGQGQPDTPDSGDKEDGNAINSNEKKTIVFSTFFKDDFFQEAKKKYEALHPNITIELKYIDTDDAHMEAELEKFVKTTGTAMLSGKGPDLIEMDQLPSSDYIRKKLLVNMNEMLEKDKSFKKEQYFNNILDGIKVNNGIYGMPIGFFITGLIGNKTLLEKSGVQFDDQTWDWNKFTQVAKELTQKTGEEVSALGRVMPEYMVPQLVNGQYATFVNEESGEANFDSPAFTNLLSEVKSLFGSGIMSEKAKRALFFESQIISPSDYIRELKQTEFMPNNNAYISKLYAKPHMTGQAPGGFFRTYKTIGMNASSKVKAEAWDFMKFMLSDEIQVRADSAGFPLNKLAYEKKVKALLEKGEVESIQPIGPMKGKVFKITQKEIDELDNYLNTAKYNMQFKPSKVDAILIEEVKSYFSGQKTAEAVAKLVQNRVSTVLNE